MNLFQMRKIHPLTLPLSQILPISKCRQNFCTTSFGPGSIKMWFTLSAKPLNFLKSSFFIIHHPSSFATFKTFRLDSGTLEVHYLIRHEIYRIFRSLAKNLFCCIELRLILKCKKPNSSIKTFWTINNSNKVKR